MRLFRNALIERQERKGYFKEILENRFFETSYFRGESSERDVDEKEDRGRRPDDKIIRDWKNDRKYFKKDNTKK